MSFLIRDPRSSMSFLIRDRSSMSFLWLCRRRGGSRCANLGAEGGARAAARGRYRLGLPVPLPARPTPARFPDPRGDTDNGSREDSSLDRTRRSFSLLTRTSSLASDHGCRGDGARMVAIRLRFAPRRYGAPLTHIKITNPPIIHAIISYSLRPEVARRTTRTHDIIRYLHDDPDRESETRTLRSSSDPRKRTPYNT